MNSFLLLLAVVFAVVEACRGWEYTTYKDLLRLKPSTKRNFYHFDRLTYVTSPGKLDIIDRFNGTTKSTMMPYEKDFMNECLEYEQLVCYFRVWTLAKFDDRMMVCGSSELYSQQCFVYYIQTDSWDLVLDMKSKENSVPDIASDMSFRNPPSVLDNDTAPLFAKNFQFYAGKCELSGCWFGQQLNQAITTYKKDYHYIKKGSEFIASILHNGRSYVFFNEQHNTYERNNFVKDGPNKFYAMVGTMCDDEEGTTPGPGMDKGSMYSLSFAKMRLLCPYPEPWYNRPEGSRRSPQPPLYFDALKSIVRVDDDVIYGLFELPTWWKVKSSAICAFSLSDIESYFNGSRFHNGQIEYYSSSGTDTGSKSTLQPGQCPHGGKGVNSRQDQKRTLKRMVKPINNRPIIYRNMVSFDYITSENMKDRQHEAYHTIFLASKDRHFEKILVNRTIWNGTLLTQYHQQFYPQQQITGISQTTEGLMVGSEFDVIQMSLHSCVRYELCSDCNLDPHCMWNTTTYMCLTSVDQSGDPVERDYIDTVFCGTSSSLPRWAINVTVTKSAEMSYARAGGQRRRHRAVVQWNVADNWGSYRAIPDHFRIDFVEPDTMHVNRSIFRRNLGHYTSDFFNNHTLSDEIEDELESYGYGVRYQLIIRALKGLKISPITTISSSSEQKAFYTTFMPAPANFSAVVTSTSVTFHWRTPPQSTREQLRLRDLATDKLLRDVIVLHHDGGEEEGVNSAIVEQLEPNTEYRASLIAVSKDGVESEADVLAVRTEAALSAITTAVAPPSEVRVSTGAMNEATTTNNTTTNNTTTTEARTRGVLVTTETTHPTTTATAPTSTDRPQGSRSALAGAFDGGAIVYTLLVGIAVILGAVLLVNRFTIGMATKSIYTVGKGKGSDEEENLAGRVAGNRFDIKFGLIFVRDKNASASPAPSSSSSGSNDDVTIHVNSPRDDTAASVDYRTSSS